MDRDARARWAIMLVLSEAADGLGGYLVVPGCLVPTHLREWVHPLQQVVAAAISAFGPHEVQWVLEEGGYDAEQVHFLLWTYRWYTMRKDPGKYPIPAGGWTVPTLPDDQDGPTFGL
jgi:hypothetical protein